MTAFETKIISLFASAPVINRLTPIGGVQYPMARFTVMIRPKCMGSTLKGPSKGMKTGPRIKVADIISMNMPMISSRIFMTSKKTMGELILPTTTSATRLGMFSKVRYRPKQVADATISNNVAEVTASAELDLDSTPGNGVPTEDDYAEASPTPVPVVQRLSSRARPR